MSKVPFQMLFKFCSIGTKSNQFFNKFQLGQRQLTLSWALIYQTKLGKKVCKTTAVQCYKCFRLLDINASDWFFCWQKLNGWRSRTTTSYSALLLTAADRSKNSKKFIFRNYLFIVSQIFVHLFILKLFLHGQNSIPLSSTPLEMKQVVPLKPLQNWI